MKIALIGYGKMGKAIEAIALQKGHTIGLKIDADNQDALTKENLQQQDVAIEFTNPNSAVKNIMACIDAGIPIVSGSTGWLDKWEKVKNYCTEKHGTLLYASNFSIGVNIFFEINKRLASLMAQHNEYDVAIEEIHHTEKKDAPSGTAITIAEQILLHNLHKTTWVNEAATNADQLSIISKRIDPAPGTHHVKYSSPIDDIEIIHTAHNRSGFAMGAVMAATYIKDKKGIFTMQDVLDIS
ncbi:4-hydroxy-tetrahydrodipicolinate reductase [Ferruginibacter sp. HRS2-29]|uniref:4-hydroxy-tetrahydrodipicolinate reductase n=1 Tax=Ferruginibacter sp. HRS2-29 TaxID=2487334 RepID=UPI0020CD7178|nr:4-hydroxy-tetrahydrodipicolinate reductase [Ferruginibacter sp. HRS2-29]MCP9750800.1 4-hydroxy-tetrahydrodipicolinate reductase [Ferruginibacter sp. HRS2-29]